MLPRQDNERETELLISQLHWLKVAAVLKEAVTSSEEAAITADIASLERVFCLATQLSTMEQDCSADVGDWLTTAHEHLKPVSELIQGIKNAKVLSITESLKAKCEQLRGVCKGGEQGGDWKQGLAKNCTWEAIVLKGKRLLQPVGGGRKPYSLCSSQKLVSKRLFPGSSPSASSQSETQSTWLGTQRQDDALAPLQREQALLSRDVEAVGIQAQGCCGHCRTAACQNQANPEEWLDAFAEQNWEQH